MGGRPARLVAVVVGLLAVGSLASSCSSLDELLQLEERIEREGYRVGSVFHEDFGTGRNEVQVEATSNRGLEGAAGQEQIAEIVWTTYPRRFQTVVVTLDDDQALFGRGELQERFGPRAERLDEREFSDDISGTIRTAAIASAIGLVVVVVAVIAIVASVRKRKRNRPPPPGPYGPFGPPGSYGPYGPGTAPPPPPGAPPPGYDPPSGYPPPPVR